MYKFTWFRSIDEQPRVEMVKAHSFCLQRDRALLEGEDTWFEIPKWSECYFSLGKDYFEHIRKQNTAVIATHQVDYRAVEDKKLTVVED